MSLPPVDVTEMHPADHNLSISGANDKKLTQEDQRSATRNNFDDSHDSEGMSRDFNVMSGDVDTPDESIGTLKLEVRSSGYSNSTQQHQYETHISEKHSQNGVDEIGDLDAFETEQDILAVSHDSVLIAKKSEEALQEDLHLNTTEPKPETNEAQNVPVTSQSGQILDEKITETKETTDGDSITSKQLEVEHVDSNTTAAKPSVEDEDEDDYHAKSVNYAHKNAGAIILSSSSSFKGTSNLLVSDNDRYAIAPCADKKTVVISLSEDILVKEVVLSNFEKYSSSVKEFQILGSQEYDANRPNAHWHDLGTFTAKPTTGGEEKFSLSEPSWARYLKFRFITHYGHEHYCTVTQIKVHGSTMVQGFHEQWKESEKELEELRRGVIDTSTEQSTDTEMSLSYSDVEEVISTEESSENEANLMDLNSSDVVRADSIIPSNESNVDGLKVESMPGKLNADSGSDEPERSLSSISKEDEDADINHLIIDTADALDSVQAHEESGTVNKNVLNATLEEKKYALDDVLEDAAQPVMGSYATIGNVLAEELIPTKTKGTTQAVPIVNSLLLNNGDLSDEEASTVELESNSDTAAFVSIAKETVTASKDDKNDQSEPLNVTSDEDYITTQKSSIVDEASSLQQPLSGDEQVQNASQKDSKIKSTTDDVQKPLMEGEPKASSDSNVKESFVSNVNQRDPLEANKAIASLIEKYPGAKCLQTLSLVDVKSKFQARATKTKQSNEPGGTSPTSSLKIEPIFKTLADEIKALQVYMSVYEQYIADMTACYQVVLMLMSADSQKQEMVQAARLTLMERKIDELITKQNNSFLAILNMFFDTLRNLIQVELKCFWRYINVLYSERKRAQLNTGTKLHVVLIFCLLLLLKAFYVIRKPRQMPCLSTGEERRKDEYQIGGTQHEGTLQISQQINNGKKRMKWKIKGKENFNGEKIQRRQ